jgi:hypothetical protein
VRRTVATLLVVASPLLLATPVSAAEDRLPARGTAHPAVMPAAPAPVPTATPAVPAPVTVAPPALPAPATAAPALITPAAPPPVRHVVKAVRAKAPAPTTADLTDAAYAAKLQAELCQARAIFCGLDRNGRYPAS